jgi:DnaJ-class molecular chaperone
MMTDRTSEALMELCPHCGGKGEVEITRPVPPSEATGGLNDDSAWIECVTCAGKGCIQVDRMNQ